MSISVNIKGNDTVVQWTPAISDADKRVPTAEEMQAAAALAHRQLTQSRGQIRPSGVMNRPNFTASGRNITIPGGLRYWAPQHPPLGTTPQAHTLSLPNLSDSVSSVSRYDRIYLMAFSSEISEDLDTDIRLRFRFRNDAGTTQEVTKENTRRIRSFYAFVWATNQITPAAVLGALQQPSGPRLTVSKAAAGVAAGVLRVYPLDPLLLDGRTYPLLPDSVELIELLRVWRVQATNQQGFFWGRTGEGNFDAAFHLQPSYRFVGEGYQDITGRARESLWRLLRGESLSDSVTRDRTVQNLVNGQVGSNLSAPGVATASPNGSTALSNEQRVTFSNAAIAQTLFAVPMTLGNSGGNAIAQINFAGNSPAGSKFSATGHRLIGPTGVDISGQGAFSGGGGTGALTWLANVGASVSPGDTAYIIPSIDYPAGSGFPVAGDIEAVYLNSTPLNPANVRELSVNPLTSFVTPAGGDSHIVVIDKARAAIAYILRLFQVTADGSGRVAMPLTARGLIAYISGPGAPAGLQDRAVVTGLTAAASYSVLCYHAPPGSEQWQFQFRVARYAGLGSGEAAWLTGARVATAPIAIAHTQIGGNPQSSADASIQHEAFGFRLPANNSASAIRGHDFSAPIRYGGEPDWGGVTAREIMAPWGGSGVAQFAPGQVLAPLGVAGSQSVGLSLALRTEGGVPLGTAKPPLVSETGYQLLVAVGLERNGDYRLLVTCSNGGDPEVTSYLPYSSDGPGFCALDLFRLY